MTLKKVSILGVSVTTSSKEAILSSLSRFLTVSRSRTPVVQIVTPNVEQIVLAQKNEDFRKALNGADIALPDGVGLLLASRIFNFQFSRLHLPSVTVDGGQAIFNKKSNFKIQTIQKRISGSDFIIDLCRVAAEKNKRVLFYGGRNGVSRQALAAVKQQIPGLDGLAEDGAEISEEDVRGKRYEGRDTKKMQDMIQHLVQVIRGRNIQVVFIGLGAPKQEFVGEALSQALSNAHCPMSLILMSVGGSFDMLAGNVKRAPKIVQTMGFEWFWRLIQEPWRWRRQCSLIEFVWLVMRYNGK